ncbi:MAG: hypothetical protein ABI555_01225 [Chloroflexota bacterium]
MKKILSAWGLAFLALVLILAPASAANEHAVTTSWSLAATSLSCHDQGEPGCVNIATAIVGDGPLGGVTFCVDVGDYRGAEPLVANGCVSVDPSQLVVDDGEVAIAPVDLPAVYTLDCYQADPEEGCVARSLTLTASASFSAVGDAIDYQYITRSVSGPCLTTQIVRGSRVDVIGSLTVNGSFYDLSGIDPSIHHFEATLDRETVRSMVRCTGKVDAHQG